MMKNPSGKNLTNFSQGTTFELDNVCFEDTSRSIGVLCMECCNNSCSKDANVATTAVFVSGALIASEQLHHVQVRRSYSSQVNRFGIVLG